MKVQRCGVVHASCRLASRQIATQGNEQVLRGVNPFKAHPPMGRSGLRTGRCFQVIPILLLSGVGRAACFYSACHNRTSGLTEFAEILLSVWEVAMSTMVNSSAMTAFAPSIQPGMVTRSPIAPASSASPSQAARTLFVTRLASFQADVAARSCSVFRRQRRSLAGPTLPSIRAVLANDAQVAREDSTEDNGIRTSVSVILLAGGKGTRMGANMPKQYLPLLGQPIALHSFRTFAHMVEVLEIVVVCDPSYRDVFEEAAKDNDLPVKFAIPGKERQDSVRNGLNETVKSAKLVCVHDSARPLVLVKDIRKVLRDAAIHGAAVLGVPVKATIKEAASDGFVTKTLDRKYLWEMQTPQVIEPELLRKGFELVEREHLEVTDDVSIVEHLKHLVFITEGSYTNLKVTTPDDLLVAERILRQGPALGVVAC